jgi:hypothetical protein
MEVPECVTLVTSRRWIAPLERSWQPSRPGTLSTFDYSTFHVLLLLQHEGILRRERH